MSVRQHGPLYAHLADVDPLVYSSYQEPLLPWLYSEHRIGTRIVELSAAHWARITDSNRNLSVSVVIHYFDIG